MTTKGHSPSEGKGKPSVKRFKSGSSLLLEKSAGAVVFHRGADLEYLLIFSTYWEFPKGQIEADEKEAGAAIREVREETGLDVDLVPGFREEITYFYRRGGRLIKKQVIYFLGEAADQAVRLSWEHREAKWLPYDHALAGLEYENAREILKKANSFLNEKVS